MHTGSIAMGVEQLLQENTAESIQAAGAFECTRSSDILSRDQLPLIWK